MRGTLGAALIVSAVLSSCSAETLLDFDQCTEDASCLAATTPYCDKTSGACVECVADNQCVSAEGSACIVAMNRCGCRSDVDCIGGTVCDLDPAVLACVVPSCTSDGGCSDAGDAGVTCLGAACTDGGGAAGPDAVAESGPDVQGDTGADVTLDTGADVRADGPVDSSIDAADSGIDVVDTGVDVVDSAAQCNPLTDSCPRQMTCDPVTLTCKPEEE